MPDKTYNLVLASLVSKRMRKVLYKEGKTPILMRDLVVSFNEAIVFELNQYNMWPA